MALQMGELMVVIRAQDFASRTLRRVSGEFAGMSREQQLMARRSALIASQSKQAGRAMELMATGRGLRLLRQRAEIEERLRKAGGSQILPGMRSRAQGLDRMGKTLEGVNKQIRLLGPEWQGLARRMEGAEGAAASLDRRLVSNRRNLDNLRLGITPLRQQLDGVNQAIHNMPVERLDRMAHALSGIGRTMQLFGAVGTVAFGLAANAAANFDTQMSLAATQARDIGAPITQVRQRIDELSNGLDKSGRHISGVLDLMNEFPASADDLSQSAYDIFSSMDVADGKIIDVAKGLGLLRDANKLAVAGGVDLAEATSAMITVLNNFDPQLEHTTREFDTMFDIVRFGRLTLSEFNIMMNKIAPAAADAGNTLEDVSGAMAYLTTVMPSQRMVATGISRLLEFLRRPDVVTGLRKIGVEVERLSGPNAGKLRALPDILRDIARAMPSVTTGQKSAAEFFQQISALGRGGGEGFIGTQEGRRAFSELLTHMNEFNDTQERIRQNQGEFANATKAQMQSLGVQWGIFLNQLKAIGIEIGQDAIPVFKQLGSGIQSLVEWWRKLDPAIRQTIVSIGVFASVGSLLGGVFLALFGSFLAFQVMIRRTMGGATGLAGALGSLRVVLRQLSALAVISIIFKTAITGDASAKQLLQGALAGGLFGASIGSAVPGVGTAAGFVIGAITVPVIMKVMEGTPDLKDVLADQILIRTARQGAKARAYGRYLAANIRAGAKDVMGRKEFDAFFDTAKRLNAIERGRLDVSKAQQREQQKSNKTTANASDQLDKWYQAQRKFKKENTAFARQLKEWQNNLEQATKQGSETAVSNLQNMYMQFEQQNRTAFGELFKGPFLTSETFDLAEEWGIKPRIQDMLRDLNEQNTQFAKWRSSLDKLMKRGLPQRFIDELRGMGVDESQPLIENILKASPDQVNRLITQYRRREQQIKTATKMDFSREINQFKNAGGDMGKAIIDGFQNAKVGLWFDTWVKSSFPGVINAAVGEAVKRFKEGNLPPTAPKSPVPPPNLAGLKATSAQKDTARGGGTKGTPGGSTITHGDTYNIYLPVQGEAGGPEMARRVAWAVKNTKRGKPSKAAVVNPQVRGMSR